MERSHNTNVSKSMFYVKATNLRKSVFLVAEVL